ncbi:UNVERIFIED_CONTAM: GDSL esterase/lipase [Sesamum radiatum]|uniref:GDSL esterase/lipase n=1 Tax=Sesamum radiatum TaxID=300843 RepID=A0AAW2JVB9_SESRA
MASLFSYPSAFPLLSLFLLAFASMASRADARAFFVFGDSLVDNGNNNYLVTSARADSPPYGIDYPTHRPTGRFSNGLNIPDIIRRTKALVNQALVLITLGGNDFVNNYYLVPYSARSQQLSLPDFVRYLISEYRKILARLYELGARRVLVTGTGPMGCVPAELAQRSRAGECAAELTRAAGLFNPQLTEMLRSLNSELGAHVFVAANTYAMHMDFISNPQAHGFITSKIACCGQGAYNGVGLCTPLSNLCPNRDVYAFWDSFHPSERANRIIVQQILTGDNKYMNPINLTTIMAMDSMT